MTTTRYELTIETNDADALYAIIETFTDIALAPSHEQSHLTDVTVTATRAQLDAYCDRFGLGDPLDDFIFVPVD